MNASADTVNLDLVLDWVNTKRREFDFEPLDALPKGQPRSCIDCVIARALSSHADGCFAAVDHGLALVQDGNDVYQEVAVPEPIQEFIVRFDHGLYPELVAA